MEKIYYDPEKAGSFSSIANLAREAKVSFNEARDWLMAQDTYTKHRLARKKFPRNRYLVDNIDDLWECDLVDMTTLSKHNDNYNFILTVLDVFSKTAWAVPLKSKHNARVIEAFKRILAGGRKCIALRSDKGKEFVGKSILKFFKEQDIIHYTSKNPDVKCAIIERFNRTLRQRMWRYLTAANTYRYIDVLNALVGAYNNAYHSSIKMSPNSVNESNVLQVWKNLYSKKQPVQKPKLKINTNVRISRKKSIFEGGYETYFSEEIFKIVRVIRHTIPVYELADYNNEKIDGFFYEHELQPVHVDKDKTYKVDKVLRRRRIHRSNEVFVKWRGYPDTFNSWIPEKDLVNLK